MTKYLTVILTILIPCLLHAQNLVPNGGFEQYSGCPNAENEIDSAKYWINPASGLNGGTPDYYNSCATSPNEPVPNNAFGYQPAHGGNAYCGIFLFQTPYPDIREYIETNLTSPLIAGKKYLLRKKG